MKEILKADKILKVYPNGIVANKEVTLSLKEKEIHALIGENGAGKSTLVKILFGMEQPDSGEIILNGESTVIENPKKAISLGIGMVHQHFMLVESLTIAENIVLGNEPVKNGIILDKKKMIKIAQEYNEKYGFKIDVSKKVSEVSVGVKQKTEILKALVRGAKILILDEPTAVLTPQETVELFDQLRGLKNQGHTIVFISHKLNEIMEICDAVTIMRHGKTIQSMSITETSVEDISRKMVGRDVVLKIPKNPINLQENTLEIKDITFVHPNGNKLLDNINLNVRGGEIVGIAGVEGNGQSTLVQILSGILEPDKGSYILDKNKITKFQPKDIRNYGLTLIPEDRLEDGTAPELSVLFNLFTNRIDTYTTKSKVFLDFNRMENEAEILINDFEILTDTVNRQVKMLSGGNMQKVVGARELLADAKLIIANQPTRGIDAGAAELMRRKILSLRDQGLGILLISSDLNEILELSDSVAVMYDGKINALFTETEELTEEELGYYMLGVKTQNPWY